ncbi:MAG TPA: gluconate:H+ symporter [Planctomycetota bacterium]
MHPLWILGISIAVVLFLIIKLKVNAFLALITAAMTVGLLAAVPPGKMALEGVMGEVTKAFGNACGSIGIVIALAAVIGQCMMESGAADKITRRFVAVLGDKNASLSMLSSGYVLAIPVFFDTVFYLLVPLARSLRVRTGKNYLLYVMAICAGGAVTHCMVPPTPGPLAVAAGLHIDLGLFILVGMVIGVPMAFVGWLFSRYMDARMPIELREVAGSSIGELTKVAAKEESELPGFVVSILPIALPVLLIGGNTLVGAFSPKTPAANVMALLGNPNFALILSGVIAMWTLAIRKGWSLKQLGESMEPAFGSAGLIILITAAGGAYGGMLKLTGVGDALGAMAEKWGIGPILFGFLLSSLIKVAQGSSTVAMTTTAAIIFPMMAKMNLAYHPVYLGMSISSGALVGSWMNDSGFWIYKQMSGLTEKEALKTWTPLLAILGVVGFVCSWIGSLLVPLK